MKRLIERKDGIWKLRGIEWEQLVPDQTITKEMYQTIYGALCKLKDYEDTGLTPEDVERVNNLQESQAGKLLAKLNKMERELKKEREKHSWIPAENEMPVDDNYVLLSISNASLPLIGRYEQYEDGSGNWYLGDCDEEDTCLANDLYVNAWMPLPERYEEESDRNDGTE